MDFKQVAILSIVLIAYLCAGAAMFREMEGRTETEVIQKLDRMFAHFLGNNTCLDDVELYKFIRDLRTEGGQYVNMITSARVHNVSKLAPLWNFAGAFTFSITIVTTIGYGHIYPASGWGRLACVLYAVFGIPLTLVVLGGLGDQLIKLQEKLVKCNVRSDATTGNKWLNIVGLVVAGILVMFVIPSTVFTFVEDWDILSSIYYCFITYSTIGFGDLVAGAKEVPGSTVYRVCIYMWILVGLTYISLVIKSLSTMFLSKAEEVHKKARDNLHKLSNIGHITAGEDGEISPEGERSITNVSRKTQMEQVELDDNKNVSLVKVSALRRE